MLIYGAFEQIDNPEYAYVGEHIYLDYLTNWVDIFTTCWAFVNLIYAFKPGPALILYAMNYYY